MAYPPSSQTTQGANRPIQFPFKDQTPLHTSTDPQYITSNPTSVTQYPAVTRRTPYTLGVSSHQVPNNQSSATAHGWYEPTGAAHPTAPVSGPYRTSGPAGLLVSRPHIPEEFQVKPPLSPPLLTSPYGGLEQSNNKDDISHINNRTTDVLPHGRIGSSTHSTPSQNNTEPSSQIEDEAPLLEELGIYPDRILKRMTSALLFYRLDHDLLIDVDMCGPLFIAACLGCCLLLAGKVHFGYIYGLSVTSCIGVCLLLNLMSQKSDIDFYSTVSILGYGLLPVVVLALLSIFISLRNYIGSLLSIFCVLWCTATASRFFETALEMTHQRYLVAYPIALIYGCFVLITVF